MGIEPMVSSLPMTCFTAKLRRRLPLGFLAGTRRLAGNPITRLWLPDQARRSPPYFSKLAISSILDRNEISGIELSAIESAKVDFVYVWPTREAFPMGMRGARRSRLRGFQPDFVRRRNEVFGQKTAQRRKRAITLQASSGLAKRTLFCFRSFPIIIRPAQGFDDVALTTTIA